MTRLCRALALLGLLGALIVGMQMAGGGRLDIAAAAQPAPDAVTKRASDRVETRIDALRRRLGITPAQQPQWDAFASVMRQNARAIESTHEQNAPRRATGTALDELRAYTIRVHTHAANLDRMLPVFESLYAVLTPEQRVIADKTLRDYQSRKDVP